MKWVLIVTGIIIAAILVKKPQAAQNLFKSLSNVLVAVINGLKFQ